MDDFSAWFVSVDWWSIAKDVAIPVAAILIPTLIAIRLSRNERLDAARASYLDSRRAAAEGVMIALAQMVSLDPSTEPVQQMLRDLRGRIAVFRTVLVGDDVLCGDWLGLKHGEGMKLWLKAHEDVTPLSGSRLADIELKLELLYSAQSWASATLETLSGWLSGHIDDEVLRRQGAALLPSRPASTHEAG